MNLPKCLLASTAFLSLFLATPYPVDQSGFYQLTESDYKNMESILENDENAEKKITDMIGERHIRPSNRANLFLTKILCLQKLELFNRITENNGWKREEKENLILQAYIFNGEFESVSSLLEKKTVEGKTNCYRLSSSMQSILTRLMLAIS